MRRRRSHKRRPTITAHHRLAAPPATLLACTAPSPCRQIRGTRNSRRTRRIRMHPRPLQIRTTTTMLDHTPSARPVQTRRIDPRQAGHDGFQGIFLSGYDPAAMSPSLRQSPAAGHCVSSDVRYHSARYSRILAWAPLPAFTTHFMAPPPAPPTGRHRTHEMRLRTPPCPAKPPRHGFDRVQLSAVSRTSPPPPPRVRRHRLF